MNGMTGPRIIVTADDLALDSRTTRAIVQSLHDGLTSHASLLANMPGCEEACQQVRAGGLEHQIGVHFNLTQGAPLTEGMRRRKEFCVDGMFEPRRFWTGLMPLSNEISRVVADEARAQIIAARAQGMPVGHLDSHNDVHLLPGILRIAVAVAREFEIWRIRPARNCGTRRGALRRVLHHSCNGWLYLQGLMRVRYFGTIEDVRWLIARKKPGAVISAEIMTHPRLGDNDAIIDAPSPDLLAVRLRGLQPGGSVDQPTAPDGRRG